MKIFNFLKKFSATGGLSPHTLSPWLQLWGTPYVLLKLKKLSKKWESATLKILAFVRPCLYSSGVLHESKSAKLKKMH
jgi:hypothetical protein